MRFPLSKQLLIASVIATKDDWMRQTVVPTALFCFMTIAVFGPFGLLLTVPLTIAWAWKAIRERTDFAARLKRIHGLHTD